jgi:hypothetical protein
MHRTCTLTRLLATAAALAVMMSVPAMAADNQYPSSAPGAISLPPGDDSDSENYGTLTTSALWIPASEFNPHDSATTYIRTGGSGLGALARTGGTGQFWAPVAIPNGATITRVEIHHFDNLATQTGFHCLTRYNVDTTYNLEETCVLFPAGTPGISRTGFVPSATIATYNNRHPYVVHVFVDSNSPTYHFWGVRVVYRLNISAAPAVATFPNDVPTSHPLFRFVEALAASGITGGCGAGSYCPNDPLTRGQMAVFLATALGLHFPDVASIP